MGSVVRLVVTDFDGVHTDNRVLVDQDGHEAVVCNRADGLACDLLRRRGIEVVILSTERNPVVTARATKLRIDCVQGSSHKGEALAELCRGRGVDPAEVLFVGNDVNDLPAAEVAGWFAVPADAHPDVRPLADHVTAAAGGAGVLRELVTATEQGAVPWRF